ncbi:MAG: E3 binding domain-containing protein, partial [Acetobacteraceae bacterium]|nr:E3 binding domain-containing protein [Acetobacteraceae bacterium]
MAATEVKVPDIGDFKDVPIIDIHVKEGDAVNAEDPLITLESDKATMDVPAPDAGTVEALLVKVGDKVSEGTAILRLKGTEEGALSQPPSLLPQQEPPPAPRPAAAPPAQPSGAVAPPSAAPAASPAPGASVGAHPAATADFSQVHASPGVRRAARELGVDLSKVKGTGEKGRITREDVLAFLRGPAAPAPGAAAPPAAGAGIPEIPAQDFSKIGPVET